MHRYSSARKVEWHLCIFSYHLCIYASSYLQMVYCWMNRKRRLSVQSGALLPLAKDAAEMIK